MSNSHTIAQLASRMHVDDSVASQWLRAVLDILATDRSYPTAAGFGELADDFVVDVDLAPVLRPVSPEASEALRCEALEMHHFPFRFGREGRKSNAQPSGIIGNRRVPAAKPNNDHYLQDRGRPLNISREHFQIELARDGTFQLVDRGSACGTIVNGNTVGGEYTKGRMTLFDGDTIIVGTAKSRYKFTFHLPR